MHRRLLILVCLVPVTLAGCGGRYLKTISGPLPLEVKAAPAADPVLDRALEEARAAAQQSGLLIGLDERIHLTVAGLVTHTVTLAQGRATIVPGVAPGVPATLTIPVTPTVLDNLRAAVADGKLDDQELFNFAHVLFLPCLRRVHGMFYFVQPGNKSNLLVDNHMQFRLKNPRGLTYHGTPVDIATTVLNVDGVFFYLPGLVGDPDARYELEVADAISLYKILVYEAERHRGSLTELARLGEQTKAILERSTTHVRAWH
jgi:hypothetical protein